MRILFISAFYPPYVIGGWEQLVEDINTRLKMRGHITHVLTSRHGLSKNGAAPDHGDEQGVERSLSLESDLVNYRPLDFFLKRRQRTEGNLLATGKAIESFNPDVVFVHGMWNLSRGIPWMAERLRPGRVVYYMANDWPYAPDTHTVYWKDPARRGQRKLLKRLLAPLALKALDDEAGGFPLRFEHVLCVSNAILRDLAEHAAIPEENMRVVYNGVETDRFVPTETEPVEDGQPLRLVYAGSLVPHKGVHTAIEALALVERGPSAGKMALTIIGSGHPDYEARLHELVAQHGLEDQVNFQPRVSRDEMPALLARFDVLVFPSTWEEPLARMTQEGMAAGLAVVGTPTGGTPEILLDGETGLTFAPGNAEELAWRLDRLQRDPELRRSLARRARELVLEKFDIRRMIDEIEDYLHGVVELNAPEPEPDTAAEAEPEG